MVLNIEVTTRKGVNYKWQTIRIPLYLKILNFFDRHFNYAWLVSRIVDKNESAQEKVLKIFHWTYENIRHQPEELSVTDDHVWYIIVRGYGARDQISDVFTTLCNYAGVDAFYSQVYSRDRTHRVPLSFVRIEKRWFVFDPYYGIYFGDKQGQLIDIGSLKSGNNWTMESLGAKPDIEYMIYLDNLPSVKEIGLNRANIQSPINRLIYEIKKWLS